MNDKIRLSVAGCSVEKHQRERQRDRETETERERDEMREMR